MYWTEKCPAWGPYAVEENRECLLSRGPLATKERVLGGEILMRLPNATLKEADVDGLFLHTKPLGMCVTDLSEESVLEAGRNV